MNGTRVIFGSVRKKVIHILPCQGQHFCFALEIKIRDSIGDFVEFQEPSYFKFSELEDAAYTPCYRSCL
jgi:hypothetical protein